MKDWIVCRGTGDYIRISTAPGRIAGWVEPCPHCQGTGETEGPHVTRIKRYIAAGPGFILAAGPIATGGAARDNLLWAAMWAEALVLPPGLVTP